MTESQRKRARNHRGGSLNISAVVPPYLYDHVASIATQHNESISAAVVRILEYHQYAVAAGEDTSIER